MNHRGGSKRLETQRRDETHSIVGTPQSRERLCGDHVRGSRYTPGTRSTPCLEPPTSLSRHADKLRPTAGIFRSVLLTRQMHRFRELDGAELVNQVEAALREASA